MSNLDQVRVVKRRGTSDELTNAICESSDPLLVCPEVGDVQAKKQDKWKPPDSRGNENAEWQRRPGWTTMG